MTSQLENPSYKPSISPQKGKTLAGLGAAWVTLTGIAIILRFWSRATSPKKKFGADDWAALASWPLVATLNLLAAEWTTAGLGRHVTDVPLGDVIKGLKILYGGYIVYNLGISLLRFSAILFYKRIFEPRNSRYRYFIWLGLGLNTAWLLAFGTIAVVPCVPIHAFWQRPLLHSSSYTCPSTLAIQLSSGITSVVVDIVVLLLPVPRLWRLQTDMRKKVRLLAIFVVAYCVVIFTIGRLISIAKAGKALDDDLTWAFVTTLYWFVCEISVASICISLPMIFQLAKRAAHHGPGALLNSRDYPTSSSRSKQIKRAVGDDGFVLIPNGRKTEIVHELQMDNLESGKN